MMGSIQEKLTRVRPPRVKITYDVETGGAIEKLELPFIVGVFADLSGQPDPEAPKVPVKDRKMVEIDRDNFDAIMAKIKPRVELSAVADVLPGAKTQTLSGAVTFAKLDHFDPMAIVTKVPRLNELYQARSRIRGLQAKAEASDDVKEMLGEAIGVQPPADRIPPETDREAIRAAFKADFADKTPAQWAFITPMADAATEALMADNCMVLKGADDKSRQNALQMLGQFYVDFVQPLDGIDDRLKADAKAVTKASDGLVAKRTALDEAREALKDKLAALAGADDEGKDAAQGEADAAQQAVDAAKADLSAAEQTLATAEQTQQRDLAIKGHSGNQTLAAWMDDRVAEIDEQLSAQLNLIMHQKPFQDLEATWRGLHYLVSRSETGKMLKLRVMNVSKKDLADDLEKAVEFDQSRIFKLIYEAEYGTYGGMPYSLLVGDYQFGRGHADQLLLKKLSEIAAAAHAPFISAAYAKLFDLQSFEFLAKPRDLNKIFESLELVEWQAFRESEDSRYVTLTLPRVLLRLPYGEATVAVDGLAFEEDVSGYDANKFLWGNSAYILAERITNAFSLYSWTAAIRGVNGGGLVEGLPAYTFKTREGDVDMVCPTQVQITDRREKELNDLGFMAICHCKGTNKAAFFGGQTTNQPRKYISDEANSNAALSARLPYILAASRFAHYIKVLMRERVGSFMTAGNVENFLNNWIAQYVLLDDDASQEVKAAYPLREAKIVVTEVPGSPGAYNATVFLKPHFQLEELTTSIRLVAKLPS